VKGMVITGLPAAGKGTHCKLLSDKYNLLHLNVGELLRGEVENKTITGEKAEEYISKGELAPDSIMEIIVGKKLINSGNKKGVCFDGFPRTVEQVELLEKLAKENNIEITGVINLDIEENVIKKRIKDRAKTGDREDDQDEEIVNRRIKKQEEELKPLLQYFKDKNKLFRVDADGEIDDVFDSVKKIVADNNLL
jgi:adenylate kinase